MVLLFAIMYGHTGHAGWSGCKPLTDFCWVKVEFNLNSYKYLESLDNNEVQNIIILEDWLTYNFFTSKLDEID